MLGPSGAGKYLAATAALAGLGYQCRLLDYQYLEGGRPDAPSPFESALYQSLRSRGREAFLLRNLPPEQEALTLLKYYRERSMVSSCPIVFLLNSSIYSRWQVARLFGPRVQLHYLKEYS